MGFLDADHLQLETAEESDAELAPARNPIASSSHHPGRIFGVCGLGHA